MSHNLRNCPTVLRRLNARRPGQSASIYKAEEKNTLIRNKKKWEDAVDHAGSSGLC